MGSWLATKSSAVLAILLASSTNAQAPGAPATVSVQTRLVQVDVIVKDAHANPVRDLQKSDFEVYDNGKRQAIRVFAVEDYSVRPEATRPLAQAAAAGGSGRPGGRSFSNLPVEQPNAPNAATVILVDAGHTWDPARMTWVHLSQAREALVQFLRQVRPEERLGIYVMGTDRFWVLREYNQDCAELVERLATWKGSATPGLADQPGGKLHDPWSEFAAHFLHVDAATAQALHRSQIGGSTSGFSPSLEAVTAGPRGTPSAANAILPTAGGASTGNPFDDRGAYMPQSERGPLAVLLSVTDHLAAIGGRKNVILISGQAFLPHTPADRALVLRSILRSGVSLYTIDPGGLVPQVLDAHTDIPATDRMVAASPGMLIAKYMGQEVQFKQATEMSVQPDLRWLAEETGGEAFLNTNDISRAIRRSFDDARVVYTLGFYSNHAGDGGAYHGLKVKVACRENLTVRARPGYFEPSERPLNRNSLDAELSQAFWSPLDASAIELTGQLRPAPDSGVAAHTLDLHIGMAGVNLAPSGRELSGRIEMILVQRDNAGNEYAPYSQSTRVVVEESNYESLVRSGLAFRRDFTADPKATSLRVVVRDKTTGNLGTLTIPLANSR